MTGGGGHGGGGRDTAIYRPRIQSVPVRRLSYCVAICVAFSVAICGSRPADIQRSAFQPFYLAHPADVFGLA